MTQHTVQVKYLRVTPRKARAISDLIRGLSANEAEARLMLQSRRAAQPLLKLLRSGVAGAKERKLNLDHLYVESIRVDQGPMLKRYLPRARGSASPIQKKTSHITLTLSESAKPQLKRFNIVRPKKAKNTPTPNPRQRTKGEEEGGGGGARPKQPGFFKRTFSRKAGFAK